MLSPLLPRTGGRWVSLLPCKWAWETLVPPVLRGQTQGLVPGGESSCCSFSLVSCLSGCLHLIAASWQHLSRGLLLQVKMLVELLTGLQCWQLHRGNRGFYSFYGSQNGQGSLLL